MILGFILIVSQERKKRTKKSNAKGVEPQLDEKQWEVYEVLLDHKAKDHSELSVSKGNVRVKEIESSNMLIDTIQTLDIDRDELESTVKDLLELSASKGNL